MCRERAAGYYTELAWALGEMIVEIPYLLIQASLYSVITYFMIWFEINAGASATLYHPFAAHHAVLREACALGKVIQGGCVNPSKTYFNHSFAERSRHCAYCAALCCTYDSIRKYRWLPLFLASHRTCQ